MFEVRDQITLGKFSLGASYAVGNSGVMTGL
jgi:hypothetical protein